MALQAHLGLPMYSQDKPCSECRKSADSIKCPSDRFGIHAARCASSANSTHQTMCMAIFQAMRAVRFPVENESVHLIPDSQRRPADILYHPAGGGKSVCYDFSVVSFTSQCGMEGREKEKFKKYEDFIQGNLNSPGTNIHFKFVPLVMDSLGRFSERTKDLIKMIAKAQGVLTHTKSVSHFVGLCKLFQFALKRAIAVTQASRISKSVSEFRSSTQVPLIL